MTNHSLHIVIGGHVDHGKSTIVGRLLADTGSLPEGKLEQVRELCARTAKPFEYAFLLDALRDERAQGITIDAARVFFRTPLRPYVIIDAPGHIEFLKNLITGAARAEAALLVIDAKEGVQENSRRHGYMMSMLGIRQVVVLVNKMDLVGDDEAVYRSIVTEYADFLSQCGVHVDTFIPVSGRRGDNIASRSSSMDWYRGPTVLEALDAFQSEPPAVDQPFRLPIQDVYKFTNAGDDRRIAAGTVLSGRARVGDEVVFLPSGKRTRIRTWEAFNRALPESVSSGEAVGATLSEQLYLVRGELAALVNEAPWPVVSSRLSASVFWLGKRPLSLGHEYVLKLGTARVRVTVEAIHRVIDASTLASTAQREAVQRHEVADCVLKCDRAIAFDPSSRIAATSRFVLVDEYEIAGGGIVREGLEDSQAWVREKVILRNAKWDSSDITLDARAVRFAQRPTLVLVTGPKEQDRKGVARALEARLFQEGRVVYFLGIGNVLYGVDADIGRVGENRREHMRRLGEIAHLMLEAGLILIVTAQDLGPEDLDLICAAVEPERVEIVWVGDRLPAGIAPALHLRSVADEQSAADAIHDRLRERGVVFSG